MNRGKVDRPFLITLTILIAFGLVMVFSASMYDATVNDEPGFMLFLKQFLFIVIGSFLMEVLSLQNYRLLNSKRFTRIMFGISVVLLLAVFIPGIGVNVNGATRWINFILFNFQPSELAKVVGILYLSSLLSREPELLKDTAYGDIIVARYINSEEKKLSTYVKALFQALIHWRGFRVYFPMAILCGLTIIEPSMSAALAIGFGMLSVLFYGGIRKETLYPVFAGGLLVVIVAVVFTPWRLERLMVLFGRGTLDYQISQSLLAIGTGGVFGQGLGNGKQKLLFLPELQNDFIFANIGEETGLIGCLIVMGLYAYLIYRGFKIARYAPNRFAYLYTASVMTLIAFQVIVNIGVAISVLPVTGMALPFISAGGTSAIVLLMMMGPVLSISREVDLTNKRGKRT